MYVLFICRLLTFPAITGRDILYTHHVNLYIVFKHVEIFKINTTSFSTPHDLSNNPSSLSTHQRPTQHVRNLGVPVLYPLSPYPRTLQRLIHGLYLFVRKTHARLIVPFKIRVLASQLTVKYMLMVHHIIRIPQHVATRLPPATAVPVLLVVTRLRISSPFETQCFLRVRRG